MKLTVIGSSGSISGPDSPSSCYLVETATTAVLLDLGSGAFGHLLDHRDPATLDAVLLSHLHADHVVDMTALEVYLKYAPNGPHPPVTVYGPTRTSYRLGQLCSSGEDVTECDHFAVHNWRLGDVVRIGDLYVEPFEALHPVEAYSLRICGPSSRGRGRAVLTFTGDTDSCEGVLKAAVGSDLLLAEAAYEEKRDHARGVHLTGRRAGELASESGTGRLVLTHIPPWTSSTTVRSEACTAYSGPIDVAAPGGCWEL